VSENPWSSLAVPKSVSALVARRVSADGRWDFFWARDSDGRSLLVMRYGAENAPRERLPKLRGMEVFIHVDEDGAHPSLALRLREGALRDLFLHFCLDIIASTESAVSERDAVALALARTWRWHHLLRGGGGGLLSPEEQKGLIGELIVLETYLLPVLSAADALAAWRGPLGEAKDFVLQRIAIESKAHGSDREAMVRVSSEFQLDASELDALFLHLSRLDASSSADDGSFTVSEVVERVRDQLRDMDERAIDRFDALLMAAGFRPEDDYAHARWNGGERGIYHVRDGFPRLVPGELPAGISSVKYNLSVAPCGPFLVDPATLLASVTGAIGVD
jgi:Putative  PD-(D/E)XK family member, (DUF4420)